MKIINNYKYIKLVLIYCPVMFSYNFGGNMKKLFSVLFISTSNELLHWLLLLKQNNINLTL